MIDEARWYVVMIGGSSGFYERRRVVPEFKAVSRIGEEGYEAFCPTLSILMRPRRGQRLRQRMIVPMWDGYCFARLDARALNLRLARWPEVFDVIRREGQPYALGDDLVESLRRVDEVMEYEDVTGKPAEVVARLLKVGDVVEHRGAAYTGLRGTISKVHRDNIEFLVSLLGSQRSIKAKARDLEVVG